VKIVISAGGRFHALHLAQQLEKRNSLKHLFTFSYTHNDRKNISHKLVSNISACYLLDIVYLKARFDRLIHKSSYNVFKDNFFDYLVNKKISKIKAFDIFVGWAHYALKSITAARKAGAKIIIESGSCHILEQKKLLEEEYSKFNVPFIPLHKKNIAKMLQEYQLADYIMTLSEFSYQSFIKHGVPKSKLFKVTCGIDVDYFLQSRTLRDAQPTLKLRRAPQGERLVNSDTYHEKNIVREKYRVIFVGLLNLRKGIQYLLQAWNKLSITIPEDQIELLLVGNLQQDLKLVLQNIPIKKNVIFYGSTSRENLRELYRSSNLFVLPSIEDGFGMVMGEAMASGLPVICTTNTGGPDIIIDQEHGFIIPARNSNALAEKIEWCYNNQETCKLMGVNAQEQIKKFTWDRYGENVHQIYKSIL